MSDTDTIEKAIKLIEDFQGGRSEGPWHLGPETYAGKVWIQRRPKRKLFGLKDAEPLFNLREDKGPQQDTRAVDARMIVTATDPMVLEAQIAVLFAARDAEPNSTLRDRGLTLAKTWLAVKP